MAYREVSVFEIRDVLRLWLQGKGLRTIARLVSWDRKTVRRYVAAAQAAGLDREGGEEQLCDELLGAVVAAVRPARPHGRGAAWRRLEAERDQLEAWCKQGLTVVKMHDLLCRQGVVVPERTLHRFCLRELGYRRQEATVPVVDGEKGEELQVDFGRMGLLADPEARRRRVVHALIFTAVFSRHMFVWLTHRETLEDVIAGCEAAWAFFGGVFAVMIPDNLSPVVAKADPTAPRFTDAFIEYAQSRGFVIDPARVRHPKDKPRVERTVSYVRGNFFAGEEFRDLADAQRHAERWCMQRAGMRIHGTIQARPVEVFRTEEAALLLPAPAEPYDLPIYRTAKVHRDHHIEVARALYSVPGALIGQHVEVRADQALVRISHRGQVVKVHPRMAAGKRSTDPDDLPADKTIYAMRDLDKLLAKDDEPATADLRALAAYLVHACLQSPPPASLVQRLGQVSRFLERHEKLLPVRFLKVPAYVSLRIQYQRLASLFRTDQIRCVAQALEIELF